mmetsp:Transcript_50353/g.93113  ORF Transcript_50353/g.93113 Transcript_50353/m.93113 type:complete len:778 (-) Transcript_50353:105-2438(-)
MRIFVHGVNTHLGKVLVQELRRTEGGYHRVFGTAVGDRTGVPTTVKRLVCRDDPRKSRKMIETIQSCRLVIVDLQNCTVDDLHFIIAALKVDSKASPPRPTGELETDVTFVLVSSVMVWAETKIEVPKEVVPEEEVAPEPAEAEEAEEGAEGEPKEEAAEEEAPAEEPVAAEGEEAEEGEAKPPPPPVRPEGLIRDSDYKVRVPLKGSRYESWKDMEELVLACFNREESKVKAVICVAGIFYGYGEDTLGELFKDAWLSNLAPAEEPGSNHIPTIHIRDMARLVRVVGMDPELNPMEQPFYFGVDMPPAVEEHSKPPTKAQLVQGIIDELSGKPVVPDSTDDDQPSGLAPPPADDVEVPEPVEVPLTGPALQAHLKDKLLATRGKPIELSEALALDLWVQPSEKMLAEGFAEDLDPPGWISKTGLVSNIAAVAAEFTAARQLRAMRVVISGPPASGKTTLATSIAAHFNIPHLDLGSRSKEACVEALNSKVCHYRGYVLECQTQGWSDMDALFRYDKEVELDDEEEEEEEEPPPPEDEEEGEEGEVKEKPPPKPKPTVRTLSENLCPEFAVILQAPEPFCRARWQAAERGSLDDFRGFFKTYSEANLTEGTDCVADFFQEVAKIPVLNLPVLGKDEEDIFESARIYVERSGRPFNYLKPGDDVASEILTRRAEREEREAQRMAAEGDLAQQAEGAARQGESVRQAERLKIIAQHMDQRAEIEGLPLRDFLMKYAVPNLTEGLIEMCKVLPEDPVDYLANYLDKCAANVAADLPKEDK